jgi:ubiquinone/menaquinone biosynthesis C-methylase UbiE
MNFKMKTLITVVSFLLLLADSSDAFSLPKHARHRTLTRQQRSTQNTDEIPIPTEVQQLLDKLKKGNDSPRLQENDMFECDASVAFWKTWDVPPEDAANNLQRIITPYLIHGSAQARAYWIYHAFRSGYFSGNAILGGLAHLANEKFVLRSGNDSSVLNSKALPVFSLMLNEALLSYEQDWNMIEKGQLNYPWDAAIQANSNSVRLQLDHKQSNPLFALHETSRLIRESIKVWGRRATLNGKPSGVWLSTASVENAIKYPSYYLNDFHYQTDGWLSSISAERYEVGTESLFLGRQDAMQRQTILPMRKHFGDTNPPAKILEVACGTGRYATFARDQFPTAKTTLVDLSPFYLEKARENDAYWRSYRSKEATRLATGKYELAADSTRFVQANAEQLPFPDNTFDAVTSIYLFHELPFAARVRVAAEMARVCKPGGVVVFSDSIQRGDRPLLEKMGPMDAFSELNEPYWSSYLDENIPALFVKHGLQCGSKYISSRTKTLSFTKERRM